MPSEAKKEPMVVGTSSYHEEYPRKHTHLEHPKKFEDNLHTGGPMTATTTYKQNFMPKSSPSQFVNGL